MDKSDDHLSEQFLAQALESTGFASISKIALQRLSRIPAAKMRLFAKRTRQIMIHSEFCNYPSYSVRNFHVSVLYYIYQEMGTKHGWRT